MKKGLFIIIPIIIVLSILFVFINNPIANTKWKLTGWSVSSISPDIAEITLEINEDNTVSGRGGVNSFSAPYTIGIGNKISIGDIQSTLMASLNPSINEAESIYFELLREVRYYELKDNELILLDSGKNEMLIFKKQ